jgi:hypothetical protein
MTEKTTLQRVEEGQAWLAKNNRGGANYIWWRAGLRPGQKMGKHVTDEMEASYAKWHKGFGMWLRLYAQLESESGDEPRDWAEELMKLDAEIDYPESAWSVDL